MSRTTAAAIRTAFERARTPDDYRIAKRTAARLGPISESLWALMTATRDRVDPGWRERARQVAEAAARWHANPVGPPPGFLPDCGR